MTKTSSGTTPATSKTPEPQARAQRPNLRPVTTTAQQAPIRLKVTTKKTARRRSDSKLLGVMKSSAKFTPLKPQSPPQQLSVFDRLYNAGKTYQKRSKEPQVGQQEQVQDHQDDVETIWTHSVKKTESYLDRHLKSKERHGQRRPQSLKLPTFSTFVKTEQQPDEKPCTAFAGGDDNSERSCYPNGETSKKSPAPILDSTSSKMSFASSFSSPPEAFHQNFEPGQLPDFVVDSDSDTTLSPDGPEDSSDDLDLVRNHFFRPPRQFSKLDSKEPMVFSEDLERNRYISERTLVREHEDRILKGLVEQTLLQGPRDEVKEAKKLENLPRIESEATLLFRDGEKLEGLVRLTNLYDHAVTFRIIPPRPIYKVDPATGTLGIGATTSVKLKTDYLSSRLVMNHDTFVIQSTRIKPGYVPIEELERFWREDVGSERIETTCAHLILKLHPDQEKVNGFCRGEQKRDGANFGESQELNSLKSRGGEEFGSSNAAAWTMGNDETCLLIQSLLDKKKTGEVVEGEEEEQEGNGRESLKEEEGRDGVNQGKGCSNSLADRRQKERNRAKLRASLVFSTGLTVCLISFLYGLHRCSNKN